MTLRSVMRSIIPAAAVAALAGHAAAQEAAETPQGPQRPVYPSEAENTSCPRADLKALADSYFAALAAHDPAGLTLSGDVRFTENGHEAAPGDSTLWAGAGEWLLRNDLIDTERCGTVSWGVMEEDGRPVHAAIRLQTDNGGPITQAEHIIGREDAFVYDPDVALSVDWVDWERILNPIQRQSRGAMNAAANDYFDMFRETPVVNTPFADRCYRWENGLYATPEHSCSPYGTGLYLNHSERRFPLADLEAGLVAAFVHFNDAVPDVHVFYMRNGKVEFIQAVISAGAPSSGWPGDAD